MKFQPLNKRVLVKPHEAPTKVGHIHLPDTNDKPTSGTVVATSSDQIQVGDTVYYSKSSDQVQVGDTVYYSKFSGTDLVIDGLTLVAIKEDDLIGMIKGK